MKAVRRASPLQGADFLKVLDGLPVAVAAIDPEGRVLFLNQAMAALTGFDAEAARGIPCRHVLRGSLCLRHCPDPREPGRAERGLEGDIVNRHRRKIPIRCTAVPVRDDQGRLLCRLDVVEDLGALREMENRIARAAGDSQMIGRGQAMERVLSVLPAVARSEAPVLVTGESGTGKDLLALAIHRASNRAREPFVKVNLGPMPESILEAELYGALAEGEVRPGKFQQANRGTLYLSEIADMPLAEQARLVRFLEEGQIRPVGGGKPARADVRIIAATHRPPEDLVREKLLREDLFHRLNAVRIHLPPLRERGEDIQFLLNHFLDSFAAKLKKDIAGFSPNALRALLRYAYPGNVRELKNIVEYAAMVCQTKTILPGHLPLHLIIAQAGAGEPEALPARRGAKASAGSGRKAHPAKRAKG